MIKFNKVIGLIIILFNIYIVWMYINLFYQYHFTMILFSYKIPDLILFCLVLIGLIGIFIGNKVYTSKWSIKKGILLDLGLIAFAFIIGQLINF